MLTLVLWAPVMVTPETESTGRDSDTPSTVMTRSVPLRTMEICVEESAVVTIHGAGGARALLAPSVDPDAISEPVVAVRDGSGVADTAVTGVVAGPVMLGAAEEPDGVEPLTESSVVVGATAGSGIGAAVVTVVGSTTGGAEIVAVPGSVEEVVGAVVSVVVVTGSGGRGAGGSGITVGAVGGGEPEIFVDSSTRTWAAGWEADETVAVDIVLIVGGAAAAGSEGGGWGAAGSVAGGVTSVEAAPSPNCAGSTPTLLTTTGAWGAAGIEAVGVGVGLGVVRSTWFFTIGAV